MASLTIAERHLWLTLSEMPDTECSAFLDAPISQAGILDHPSKILWMDSLRFRKHQASLQITQNSRLLEAPSHSPPPLHSAFKPRTREHTLTLLYQYTVLPFGLSLAPRTFTMCMDVVLAPLKLRGMRVLNYLDDWLILAHRTQDHITRTTRKSRSQSQLGEKFAVSQSENIFSGHRTGLATDARVQTEHSAHHKILPLRHNSPAQKVSANAGSNCLSISTPVGSALHVPSAVMAKTDRLTRQTVQKTMFQQENSLCTRRWSYCCDWETTGRAQTFSIYEDADYRERTHNTDLL